MVKNKVWVGVCIVLIAVIVILSGTRDTFAEKSLDEKREEFISERDAIIQEQIVQGKYACCLEKPCTYCIEKTPKHGEGASCSCLDDVMNGVHFE
jgi:hypothetical protein